MLLADHRAYALSALCASNLSYPSVCLTQQLHSTPRFAFLFLALPLFLGFLHSPSPLSSAPCLEFDRHMSYSLQ